MTMFDKDARQKRREWFEATPARRVLFVALCVVLGLLISLLYFGVERATAATPQDAQAVTCDSYGQQDACSPVKKRHKKMARKLRNGDIAKTKASYDMRDAFKHKKKIKRLMVNRIQTGLHASQGAESAFRAGCCSKAYARSLYVRIVDQPYCSFTGKTAQIADVKRMLICNRDDTPSGDGPKMITYNEAKMYGTIFFCGATSVAAVGAAIGTGGLATWGAVGTIGGCSFAVTDSIQDFAAEQ